MAIWNLRAKMVYGHGLEAFTWPVEAGSHPDYPPLLPLVVAIGWHLFGMSLWVPIALQAVILILPLILIRFPWWVITLLIVTLTPFAASQTADLALGISLLAASAAYYVRRSEWVGIALGVGVLLKNEGLLIALSMLLVWMVVERRIVWRALLTWVPFVVILLLFKHWVGIPNDIVGEKEMFARLMEVERYAFVAGKLLSGLLLFNAGVIPVLLIGSAICRRTVSPDRIILLTLAMVWAGYYLVYVITPYDMDWHIRTSYGRLLVHLFPTLAFVLTRGTERSGCLVATDAVS